MRDFSFSYLRRSRPVIPVLRLSGAIGLRGGGERLRFAEADKLIERAFAVKGEAVAIALNSPGGLPAQASLIHRRLRDLSEKHGRPIYVFVEDAAASGGYMIACAGDFIFVDPYSIVGSIGVISAGFGFAGLIEKWGIERRVHTAGDRKGFLDSFAAEDPEEVERLKVIQEQIHASFMALVRQRRGGKLKEDEAALFSGEFWCGARAVELGLADGVGAMHAVLRERFGERVTLRPIVDKGGFAAALRRHLIGAPVIGAPAAEAGAAAASGLLGAAEDASLWGRYGL